LKELGVLKTENEELKKRLSTIVQQLKAEILPLFRNTNQSED